MPTVTIVTEQFVSLAKSAARAKGLDDLRMVVVPHPFETLPRDRIREIAREKASEIIAAITKAESQKVPM